MALVASAPADATSREFDDGPVGYCGDSGIDAGQIGTVAAIYIVATVATAFSFHAVPVTGHPQTGPVHRTDQTRDGIDMHALLRECV